MFLHPSLYGGVDLTDPVPSRPPKGRPDGVRVVRRPQPTPPEARS